MRGDTLSSDGSLLPEWPMRIIACPTLVDLADQPHDSLDNPIAPIARETAQTLRYRRPG